MGEGYVYEGKHDLKTKKSENSTTSFILVHLENFGK